ncbi:SET domain-containing protein [Hirsutella rhossiliensis]|uniref:SET domain-containing protein n=1 Tax=Hirsutella rhossiliensis TaxID=111463 RepID=A0A9P8N3T8_9HYPO|nr:SET domain-containing protein [Hirsutella rhossiliensis]KAH0964182.1 SET domain-containing protein [Hirsutella rhossiliensis]
MQATERLLQWATAQGVILNGVEAKPLPGRGIGIVATRPLKAKEDVLKVPCTLLRSLATTPKPVARKLKGAPVQALLAAALCLDADDDHDAAWRAVFPSRAHVEASMPIYWPRELHALLPPTARRLRDRQRAKFGRDWALVAAAYPDAMTRRRFLYAWNLVNSRTFYHATPQTETTLPREDRIALQPVADLFNHAPDGGCSVAFDHADYTFTTTRPHGPGDELFICYGPHSNDFLLVEYGFTLAGNPWDETCLDPYLCPFFSASQRQCLQDAGFWERYMLDAETACFRTQMALRILCLAPAQWRAVLDGTRPEDQDQDAADAELLKVLTRYEKDIRSKLVEIDRAGDDASGQAKACLRSRWIQIKQLVVTTISRLQN